MVENHQIRKPPQVRIIRRIPAEFNEGLIELKEALKAKKSKTEVMAILVRHPRLMATFIRMNESRKKSQNKNEPWK